MSLSRTELAARARRMRKSPTEGEAILWAKLRRKQLHGLKFRRQHILFPYIVDFYCRARRLVIEIDGGAHHKGNSEYDSRRMKWLQEQHGVTILRFTEEETIANVHEITQTITTHLT